MRPAVRISLAALGLAAAAYGTASLTGGWLGEPPWWIEELRHEERVWRRPYEQREFVSVLVAMSGLGIVASIARPRLRQRAIRPSIRLALVVMGIGLFSYATYGRPGWLWDSYLWSFDYHGDRMHGSGSPLDYMRLWPGRGVYLEGIVLLSGLLAFAGVWPGAGCLRRPYFSRLFWVGVVVLALTVFRFVTIGSP